MKHLKIIIKNCLIYFCIFVADTSPEKPYQDWTITGISCLYMQLTDPPWMSYTMPPFLPRYVNNICFTIISLYLFLDPYNQIILSSRKNEVISVKFLPLSVFLMINLHRNYPYIPNKGISYFLWIMLYDDWLFESKDWNWRNFKGTFDMELYQSDPLSSSSFRKLV